MSISMHTSNCVSCGRKAVQWTGHVTAKSYGPIGSGGQMPIIAVGIIAGFCDSKICNSKRYCMDHASSDANGCYGKWHSTQGLCYTPGEQAGDRGIMEKVANEDFVTIELSTLQALYEKAERQ